MSCDERGAVTFTVGKKTYGVNGIAKSYKYPAIDVIWMPLSNHAKLFAEFLERTGYSIEEAQKYASDVKVNIGPILDTGLELCR